MNIIAYLRISLTRSDQNQELDIDYFFSCVKHGEVRLTQLLIRHGVNPTQTNPRYIEQKEEEEEEEDEEYIPETALEMAIDNDDILMVQFLLQDERIAIKYEYIWMSINKKQIDYSYHY